VCVYVDEFITTAPMIGFPFTWDPSVYMNMVGLCAAYNSRSWVRSRLRGGGMGVGKFPCTYGCNIDVGGLFCVG
jgi:hypothetical protein